MAILYQWRVSPREGLRPDGAGGPTPTFLQMDEKEKEEEEEEKKGGPAVCFVSRANTCPAPF